MKGAAIAGLTITALLVGLGIGYFAGIYSQRAVTTPSVLIGVSMQACDSEGLAVCGQQLADMVNKTNLFVKAENGSNFVFQKSASSEGIAYLANGTKDTFGLVYDLFGPSPAGSGCKGISSVIQVSIPLVSGYYAVSQMTVSRQPPVCSALPA